MPTVWTCRGPRSFRRPIARARGPCPQCGAGNSMVSDPLPSTRPAAASRRTGTQAVRLSSLDGQPEVRYPMPMDEFARVLGGGIVPGSLVLVGGDPGIGKSTLLLQTALGRAAAGRVLHVSR